MKKDAKELQNKKEYPHKSLQVIEDKRLEFWKSYRKHNSVKTIVAVLCFIAVIVAFVLVPRMAFIPEKARGAVTLLVTIVFLGAGLAYSFWVRKKFDRRLKIYFNEYFKCINEFALDSKDFKDVELQSPGKITLDEFNECKLYKDVSEAGSRGLTTFKYKKLDLSIVDCAGNIKAARSMKPVFVGKMLRGKVSYKGKTPIFVYLKGNDRALPPTNLEEVKNVFEDNKMAIYTNGKDWKKVITGSVTKALNAIKTEKILVDVAISLYEGKAYIMMGYDDPLMVLPMQNEFDSKPTEKYKRDIKAVCELLEALNK